MHDDRVPNVSRWTQFAALGRSSPSGSLWSTRTRRNAATTSSAARPGGPEPAARGRPCARARPRARFSSTWIPGGSAMPAGSANPVKSTKKRERAVPHEQPRPVVVLGPVGRPGARRPRRPPSRGGPARAAAHPVTASRGPWRPPAVGWSSPAQTPCSLTASQVPPESSSRPPRTLGGPSSRTVIGRRRAVQDLVAVGAHDQRLVGYQLRRDDEEAHGVTLPRHRGGTRSRARTGAPPVAGRGATVRSMRTRACRHGRCPGPRRPRRGPGTAGVGPIGLRAQPQGLDQEHQPREDARRTWLSTPRSAAGRRRR